MTGPAPPGGPSRPDGAAPPGDPTSPGGSSRPDGPAPPDGPSRPDSPAPPRVPAQPGPSRDDLEDLDPGLARERTSLAWTRTAISFAAVAGVVLKKDIAPGLVIMAAALVIWRLGHLAHHRPGRLKLVTATIVAIALVALGVALTGS
jgi:uncharacterized membrane protein YidH (DUF202 family)